MSKSGKRETRKTLKVKTESEEELTRYLTSTAPTQAVTAELFNETFAQGRRLVYAKYNGQSVIHVREYAKDEEKEYPTKIGVCLTPSRLHALNRKIEEIDEELRQQNANVTYMVEQGEATYKTHLGGGIYASVSSKFNGVDLRRYWVPVGVLMPVPTKNGIYLPASQWRALKTKLEELMFTHQELDTALDCLHQNQMEVFDCRECTPFGFL